MNDFLSKPLEIHRLDEVLTQWLHAPDCARGAGTGEAAAAEQIMSEQTMSEQAISEQIISIFDAEALLKRMMGDRPLVEKILKGFVRDFSDQVNNLRSRLAAADADGVRLQAHTVKGSAATVAAGNLSGVGAEMERAAIAGELDRAGELLPRLAEEFDRLKNTLQRTGWL